MATGRMRLKAIMVPAPVLPGFEHLRRYWDRAHGRMTVSLLPGEFYASMLDEVVITVLGSCVSACIHDPVRGIGGINHFMLPEPFNERDDWSSTVGRASRYGCDAMEQLINAVLAAGANRSDLQVKIFGGGAVMSGMTDVGQQNIQFVKRYLTTEKLQLGASDVGGSNPRQLQFFPHSGRVRVRLLQRQDEVAVAVAERGYLKRLANDPIRGEVELFLTGIEP